METLETEIKNLLITTLHLEGMKASDIDSTAPIFNAGLGLDSIDALEIGIALQKHFKIKIDNETQDVKKHFASIRSLAQFITSCQKQKA